MERGGGLGIDGAEMGGGEVASVVAGGWGGVLVMAARSKGVVCSALDAQKRGKGERGKRAMGLNGARGFIVAGEYACGTV